MLEQASGSTKITRAKENFTLTSFSSAHNDNIPYKWKAPSHNFFLRITLYILCTPETKDCLTLQFP